MYISTQKRHQTNRTIWISTSPTPYYENLRQQHPNNSKQYGALAFYAPETDMIFGDGVGAFLVEVLAPSACCQSLPKHHVVWNCLGVVVAGFRNMTWVRCWFRCGIAGGMLFSVFALAVDRFVTIGRRTPQFCCGLLMLCLFLGSPPSPP